MYTLEVNEIFDILDAAPNKMNVMLVGDSGIGKTHMVEKYARERGLYMKTLILSKLEASESLGIPVKSERKYNGRMYPVLDVAIPNWVFDLAEHKDGALLFLDEFLCGQPSTMNSFLNFLTQKSVEGIDLSHVKIIAATNVGNYTFEPDHNMIARFCWFYVQNTSMNEYLKDKRIVNNYIDRSEKTGVIFDVRDLKPRCQEWLMDVDDDHLQMFYEGFTNRKYVIVHRDKDINELLAPYFQVESGGRMSITPENIDLAVTVLTNTFKRIRKWDNILEGFVHMDLETVNTLQEKIKEAVGE